MRILLVNDDGIYAAGIMELKNRLLDGGFEVMIVAPHDERSATGHGISLHRSLELTCYDDHSYSCSGLPADCVFMAINYLFKDRLPDLVISGINRGANLAQDVYYSGTVAAAREASFANIPSVALSLVVPFGISGVKEHYKSAGSYIEKFVSSKEYTKIPARTVININVPNLSEEEILPPIVGTIGFRKYDSYVEKHDDLYRIRGTYSGFEDFGGSSDCEIVEKKHISITALNYEKGVVNSEIKSIIF